MNISAAFIQTDPDYGLYPTQINDLIIKISNKQNGFSFMRAAESKANSCAFGFGSISDMTKFDIIELDIEYFVQKIIDDKVLENETKIYEFAPDFYVYIGY